jgi:hypothetical protein
MITTASPGEGWILVARGRLKGDRIYNAGCQIPVESAGRNLQKWLSSGMAGWMPPNTPVVAAPRDLPKPKKQPKKPVLHIFNESNNPVENWVRTRNHMISECDGNVALARDYLESDPAARELFKLAQKVGVAEAKQKRGVQTLSPNDIGL